MRWAAALGLLLVLLLAGLPGAQGGDFPAAARKVAQELEAARREQAELRAAQAAELKRLRAQLKDLQARLAAEEKALAADQARLEEVSRRKDEAARALREEQGDLDELAGLVRASARELLSLAETWPSTAEHPRRLEVLRSYLDKSRFPGLEDIRRLIETYLTMIAESGQVVRRRGRLVDRAGREVEGQIVRLGELGAIYRHGDELGYLVLGRASGRLLATGGEPPWRVRRNLAAFLDGQSEAVYLDVSGGGALRQMAHRQGLWEQLLSGGPLVWPILLVGLISLVLIVERLLFLRRVRANTDVMMEKVNRLVQQGDFAGALAEAERQPGQPTSNVIKAGLKLRGQPAEVIENGLSEAMLKELPRLERFLTALKVMAAVAPLLGLLGTVTGMINTFNVITTHGTGDPRLMAGGISEALVTTQLGLAVAIPVLVAASLLARRAQRVVSDMEEKAVALTAALIQEAKQP
jgi:biopolymer transport protein ExbB